MFYLAEIRESDGNDCTVYDAIVEANSQEAASDRLHAQIEDRAKDLESDGDWGYYFPCDCPEDMENCEGHGGITVDAPEQYRAFATEKEAIAAHSVYHSRFNF